MDENKKLKKVSGFWYLIPLALLVLIAVLWVQFGKTAAECASVVLGKSVPDGTKFTITEGSTTVKITEKDIATFYGVGVFELYVLYDSSSTISPTAGTTTSPFNIDDYSDYLPNGFNISDYFSGDFTLPGGFSIPGGDSGDGLDSILAAYSFVFTNVETGVTLEEIPLSYASMLGDSTQEAFSICGMYLYAEPGTYKVTATYSDVPVSGDFIIGNTFMGIGEGFIKTLGQTTALFFLALILFIVIGVIRGKRKKQIALQKAVAAQYGAQQQGYAPYPYPQQAYPQYQQPVPQAPYAPQYQAPQAPGQPYAPQPQPSYAPPVAPQPPVPPQYQAPQAPAAPQPPYTPPATPQPPVPPQYQAPQAPAQPTQPPAPQPYAPPAVPQQEEPKTDEQQ
ncbi:MAG: hypothetical protein LBQ80_00160 [Clostridium sp.]|nr:hypothetical protein [Clostridium sp.]